MFTCVGRDAKKSNFLAVWTGGSFLITKWHTAIPILWWFIVIHGKKGTLYNHALNYTTRSSVFFSARILTRLVFMYSYRGLPEPSAIMNSVYYGRDTTTTVQAS